MRLQPTALRRGVCNEATVNRYANREILGVYTLKRMNMLNIKRSAYE